MVEIQRLRETKELGTIKYLFTTALLSTPYSIMHIILIILKKIMIIEFEKRF